MSVLLTYSFCSFAISKWHCILNLFPSGTSLQGCTACGWTVPQRRCGCWRLARGTSTSPPPASTTTPRAPTASSAWSSCKWRPPTLQNTPGFPCEFLAMHTFKNKVRKGEKFICNQNVRPWPIHCFPLISLPILHSRHNFKSCQPRELCSSPFWVSKWGIWIKMLAP